MLGTDQERIYVFKDTVSESIVRSLYPKTNFNDEDFSIYGILESWGKYASAKSVIKGSTKSGSFDDTWTNNNQYHIVASDSNEVEVKYWPLLVRGKTFDLYYDLSTSTSVNSITLKVGTEIVASTSGTLLFL